MGKKYLSFGIFFLIISCGTISTNTDIPLIQRISKSSWKIQDTIKENQIIFSNKKVQLKSTTILGTAPTEYSVVSEAEDFTVISVFQNVAPYYLGIQLINNKTIRASIWQETLTTKDAQDYVTQNGSLYQLK